MNRHTCAWTQTLNIYKQYIQEQYHSVSLLLELSSSLSSSLQLAVLVD